MSLASQLTRLSLAFLLIALSFCSLAQTNAPNAEQQNSSEPAELPQCDIPATKYQYSPEHTFSRWIFNLAVEAQLGGRTFAKVPLKNGETKTMHAGDGTLFALGVLYRSFHYDTDVGIKLGYLFDKTTVRNTELKDGYLLFERRVADLYMHHRDKRHRYGGGLSYHFNNRFTSRTDTMEHMVVNNSLGVFAEYLYDFPSSSSLLGLKYFYIDYTAKGDDTNKANASGFGVAYRFYF